MGQEAGLTEQEISRITTGPDAAEWSDLRPGPPQGG